MQQYADIYSLPCHSTPVRIRPRWKEVTVPLPWHTPEVADTVFSTPDDECVTPETCRVTWQWINVCILLHRVGPLLTLNHDARNHVFKKPKQALQYKPKGRKNIGRPRKRWRDQFLFEDQGTGNTPNPSWTWWWWWWWWWESEVCMEVEIHILLFRVLTPLCPIERHLPPDSEYNLVQCLSNCSCKQQNLIC